MISFVPDYFNLPDQHKAWIDSKENFEQLGKDEIEEYIFIIDRSGSRSGSRTKYAKEALELFLKGLSEDSKFNGVKRAVLEKFGNQTQIFKHTVWYYQLL